MPPRGKGVKKKKKKEEKVFEKPGPKKENDDARPWRTASS